MQSNSIVHFKMNLLYVNLLLLLVIHEIFELISLNKLDFGLTYCPNGDLLQYILDAGHFELDTVRFYAAEIIEGIEQLHIRKIIHRDLKVDLEKEKHKKLFLFEKSILARKYSPFG